MNKETEMARDIREEDVAMSSTISRIDITIFRLLGIMLVAGFILQGCTADQGGDPVLQLPSQGEAPPTNSALVVTTAIASVTTRVIATEATDMATMVATAETAELETTTPETVATETAVPETATPEAMIVQSVSVPNYGIFEVELAAQGDYANPYLMMPGDNSTPGFVVGTFTGPEGQTITIDGFWDGGGSGKSWKIRMAPTAVGIWSYTTSSTDPGLDGKQGAFESVPSANKGFIRINPEYPRTFMYDDGTPFFWMGATIGVFYLYEGTIDMRDGTFQAVHDALAAAGYNNYLFSSQIFKKMGTFVQNEGGFNFLNSDPDQLNPFYWQWADLRLEYVNGNGVVPGLMLGWPDQGIFSRFSEQQLKRALRYAIARYSAYNIVWNLFGELNEAGSGWKSIANEYGNMVARFDPYDHLRTTHHTRSSSDLAEEPWYDFIEQQHNSVNLVDSDRLKYLMPVVNAEFYYEDLTGTAEEIRTLSWKLMTHGAFFQYGKSRAATLTEGQRYNVNLFNFYEGTEWWKLEPNQGIVEGSGAHAHAALGSEYVVYLEFGGSVTLDLTAVSGSVSVDWYNPRKGEYLESMVADGGEMQTFTAPDDKDWILHIKRVSN
jgi:hypothetical protein